MKDELVYYIHDQSDSLRFQLAGDLTQETTRDLEQARQTAWSVIGGRSLIVDVTNVKSADEGGREFLEQWHATGAQFIVKSADAQSDTPREAGGLMSWAASKSSELFCQEESENFSERIDSNPFSAG
jgi:ABC-type transporter Mla MlaB component